MTNKQLLIINPCLFEMEFISNLQAGLVLPFSFLHGMISGDSRLSAGETWLELGTISGPSCVASVGGWNATMELWEIIKLKNWWCNFHLPRTLGSWANHVGKRASRFGEVSPKSSQLIVLQLFQVECEKQNFARPLGEAVKKPTIKHTATPRP